MHKGVTAHRGNSIEFNENTIPAFQSAIDMHVDWVELDIHRTKDGQLVISHDATTKRIGDIDMSIASSTYNELKKVDIASGFRRSHGLSKKQCPPQRIALLEDAIALIMKQSLTKVSIQPKVDCVSEAIAIIRKAGAERMTGFNDGNLRFMSKVKQLAPEIRVFWDRPADSAIDEDIRIAKEKRFEALVINHSGITDEKARKVRSASIELGAWTVNDRQTMIKLLSMGVERIYTDDPKLLIAVKSSN